MDSIVDIVKCSCEKYSDRELLIDEIGNSITYSDFYSQVVKTSKVLEDNDLLVRQARFSIIAPNSLRYLTFLFALLSKNNTAVNLNPSLTDSELINRLKLAEVTLVITTKELGNRIKEVAKKSGVLNVVTFSPENSDISELNSISLGGNKLDSQTLLENRSPAFFQFTGGTSGVTKAAVITHDNVISNVKQIDEHIGKYYTDSPTVLIAFPFYHIFSLVFNFLFFLNRGGSCVLYKDLRDTDLIIDLMIKNKVTATVGVNTWYKKIMNHAKFSEIDFSSIKFSFAGGEYVPVSTKNEWYDKTGNNLYSAYGLTETSALAIASPLERDNVVDSIGKPLPRTQVALFDESGIEVQAKNIPGEIALKGPQITSLYYENNSETKIAFKDGWFLTGDIAMQIDNDYYKLIDRKKDMISVSGNKVYPNEVEEVLSQLEYIIDAGVVAKKDVKSGEHVAACVVIKPKSDVTDKDIIEYCRRYLARYKVPKSIYRYKSLPKSPIGKTVRNKLKLDVNN